MRIGRAKPDEINPLSHLRKYKANYRRGVADTRVSWAHASRLINIVDGIFDIGLQPKRTKSQTIIQSALDHPTGAPDDLSWYATSRRIEAAIHAIGAVEAGEATILRDRLMQVVRSPSSYVWHHDQGIEWARRALKGVASLSGEP